MSMKQNELDRCIIQNMHALSRQLATTLRLTTHRQPVIARPLHTTTELSRRCRDYFGFRQEEGRWVPKKRSFNVSLYLSE